MDTGRMNRALRPGSGGDFIVRMKCMVESLGRGETVFTCVQTRTLVAAQGRTAPGGRPVGRGQEGAGAWKLGGAGHQVGSAADPAEVRGTVVSPGRRRRWPSERANTVRLLTRARHKVSVPVPCSNVGCSSLSTFFPLRCLLLLAPHHTHGCPPLKKLF